MWEGLYAPTRWEKLAPTAARDGSPSLFRPALIAGKKGIGWRAQTAHVARMLPRSLLVLLVCSTAAYAHVGVGAKPLPGAEVILDGTRAMLDAKWVYWDGPRGAGKPPIKWPSVTDPVDGGTVISTDDPTVPKDVRSKYGIADIVTKKPYRDFRLHVEFMVMADGGNSGVYLQNRFEIQIQDGVKTKHGMGAVINETESPYHLYKGQRVWNSYDILFRAARFKDGKLVERPRVTLYFNGTKAHTNVEIQKVWGGANSGVDGGNDGGRGLTETPAGLKLQAEGHDVRYRNVWIKEVVLDRADTDFPPEA